MKLSKNLLLLAVVLLAIAGYFAWKYFNTPDIQITNFESCVAAGNPVMETYPEQCRTADGRTFTRSITDQEITVTGSVVCLPHKDKEGPQTLECAIGIQDSEDRFYAISDPDMKYIASLPTGKNVTVTGTLVDTPDSIYDTVGVIEISSITQ